MSEQGKCYWLDDEGNCRLEWNETKRKYLCTKRPSACDDYMENFIGEPVYSIGDTVWYFDNEGFPTICKCEVLDVSIVPGSFPVYRISETSGRTIGSRLTGHCLFPTRDALCEYYKKIFEL